jgi:hypothetical protein
MPRSATAVALPVADDQFGPAMRALPENRRRYVLALLVQPPGRGAMTRAARAAGFGGPDSNARTMAVIASRLSSDPRIERALHEEGLRHLQSAAPRAVTALVNAIERPGHKSQIRAAIAILERVYPAEVNHHVEIDDRRPPPVTSEMIARIVAIAKAVNAPNPTVIEQDIVEVAPS